MVVFYKGPGLEEQEGEDLGIDKKKWEIMEDVEHEVSEGEHSFLRRILIVQNKKVPRGTNLKSKKLVKLSTLL